MGSRGASSGRKGGSGASKGETIFQNEHYVLKEGDYVKEGLRQIQQTIGAPELVESQKYVRADFFEDGDNLVVRLFRRERPTPTPVKDTLTIKNYKSLRGDDVLKFNRENDAIQSWPFGQGIQRIYNRLEGKASVY